MSDQPIKTARAAEAVARHIETLILEGSLRPGEALLSERDLAGRLEVSRPTLRDGLKLLEERGLLVSAKGRGMRIAALGQAAISDPLVTLLGQRPEVADDYLEFRDIVEGHAAALAAKRASRVDLDQIGACLLKIEAAHDANDPVEEATADAELHLAIYEASHNLVLLQIMRALSGNLRNDVSKNRNRMFTIPAIRDLLRDQHRSIAKAILRGDAEAARRASHEHLAYIRSASQEIQEAEIKLDLSLRRLNGGGVGQSRSLPGG